MALLSRRTRVAAKTARTGIRTYGRAKWWQGRFTAPRHPSRRPAFLAGLGLGALVAFFMDPAQGGRRRHAARDRGSALLRRSRREAEHAAASATGAVHAVTPDTGPRAPTPMNQ